MDKTCSCGYQITKQNAEFIGIQHDLNKNPILELYNCPNCHTTLSRKVIVKHVQFVNLQGHIENLNNCASLRDNCEKLYGRREEMGKLSDELVASWYSVRKITDQLIKNIIGEKHGY